MPPHLADWMAEADTVLLEADGAKRHPCKAPAAHEPVLLRSSDIVLAAAGLSAMGKPLQDVCFRLEAACALLAVPPETPLTPALLAKLLASEAGGRSASARGNSTPSSTRPTTRPAVQQGNRHLLF